MIYPEYDLAKLWRDTCRVQVDHCMDFNVDLNLEDAQVRFKDWIDDQHKIQQWKKIVDRQSNLRKKEQKRGLVGKSLSKMENSSSERVPSHASIQPHSTKAQNSTVFPGSSVSEFQSQVSNAPGISLWSTQHIMNNMHKKTHSFMLNTQSSPTQNSTNMDRLKSQISTNLVPRLPNLQGSSQLGDITQESRLNESSNPSLQNQLKLIPFKSGRQGLHDTVGGTNSEHNGGSLVNSQQTLLLKQQQWLPASQSNEANLLLSGRTAETNYDGSQNMQSGDNSSQAMRIEELRAKLLNRNARHPSFFSPKLISVGNLASNPRPQRVQQSLMVLRKIVAANNNIPISPQRKSERVVLQYEEKDLYPENFVQLRMPVDGIIKPSNIKKPRISTMKNFHEEVNKHHQMSE